MIPGAQILRRWLALYSTRIYVDEFTNPPTADDDAYATASVIISSASNQTIAAADFDGATGSSSLTYARNVTLTLSNHADWDATDAVVTGLDILGHTISETLAIPNGGNTTVVGAKAFKSVTSLAIPAQSGTGGTATLGFGALLGLSKKALTRAGTVAVVQEIEAGVVVATGTWAIATTGAPHGTYAPANAPNASRDYAVYYELDTSVF